MSRHTKYIQNMIKELESGKIDVISPDKLVMAEVKYKYICNKYTKFIRVYHYGSLILEICYRDALRYISKNGRSFTITINAYSPTDARIINQFIEFYAPGYIAHSRKGEVIVD